MATDVQTDPDGHPEPDGQERRLRRLVRRLFAENELYRPGQFWFSAGLIAGAFLVAHAPLLRRETDRGADEHPVE